MVPYSFLQPLKRPVKRDYLGMVLRYKSDVNGLRCSLPFFKPEKISFAITKTFQIWVSVFDFVVNEGVDMKVVIPSGFRASA